MPKPECANWQMWIGKEVEGNVDVGTLTLFIRSLKTTPEELQASPEFVSSMTKKGTITRVWFCKEFTDWALMREISKHFKTACLETTLKLWGNLPRDIVNSFTIYLKVDLTMKKGDFVCVGPAFQDEAFQIGTGAQVLPEQYANDIKIK